MFLFVSFRAPTIISINLSHLPPIQMHYFFCNTIYLNIVWVVFQSGFLSEWIFANSWLHWTQLDSFTYCCCSFFLRVSRKQGRKEKKKLKYKKKRQEKNYHALLAQICSLAYWYVRKKEKECCWVLSFLLQPTHTFIFFFTLLHNYCRNIQRLHNSLLCSVTLYVYVYFG